MQFFQLRKVSYKTNIYMNIAKKSFIAFIILIQCSLLIGQDKFKVKEVETGTENTVFELVNKKGEVFKTLDTTKYFPLWVSNNSNYGYFAIFKFYDSVGVHAIDADENVLFKVFNISYGITEPDYLIENKIRIVDNQGKIGFANKKGTIIIKPQFEFALSFFKGKAIIGENCNKHYPNKEDNIRFERKCEKYGYINTKGKVIKIGNYTLEEIIKETKWEE